MKRLLLTCAAGIMIAGCWKRPSKVELPQGEPTAVWVGAASSLRDLLEKTKPPMDPQYAFEASSTLSRQFDAGSRFDLFLSADAESVDRLAGLIDPSTRRVFLLNRLALIGPTGGAGEGFASTPAGAKIAIAGPEVPAGKAWRKYLQRIGRLADLEPRFVVADNVRAALALFDSGTVDAALVYSTDAMAARRGHSTWVPADAPPTQYVAVAMKTANSLAIKYLDWLASPEFLKAAKEMGFQEPPPK